VSPLLFAQAVDANRILDRRHSTRVARIAVGIAETPNSVQRLQ